MVNRLFKTDEILHILRNPYGHSEEKRRAIRLAAADEIERWQNAYKNMREFAEANGLDTTTHGIADG